MAALLMISSPVQADRSSTTSTISTGFSDTTAVPIGSYIYLFGGCADSACPSPYVYRYDPSLGSLAITGTTLPLPLGGATGVSTGTHAYIFGGYHGSVPKKDIFRYDPSTNALVKMGASLPSERGFASAIWDGTYVWVFGGRQGPLNDLGSYSAEILRYHPGTDTLVSMAQLPSRTGFTSAVWDGSKAFIFGGMGCDSVPCSYLDVPRERDAILSFDPSSLEVAVEGSLPTPRSATSAAFDGAHVYVFGGSQGSSLIDKTVRFTPATRGIDTMCSVLTAGKSSSSSVWWQGHALIFFGYETPSRRSRAVTRFDLTPSPPIDLQAETGSGPGEISLTWTAPPQQCLGGSPTYQVFRSMDGGSETLVATIQNETRFVDQGLPTGATRRYRVRTATEAGVSDLSAPVEGSTARPADAPERLSAAPGPYPGQALLVWQPPSRDGGLPVTGYRIYRGELGRPERPIGEVATSSLLTFIDSQTCRLGTICFYSVTALNAQGAYEGAHSGPAFLPGTRT